MNLYMTCRRYQPDLIHLHSSWAGLLGRLVPLGRRKIVYTPHCYAFERRDLSQVVRIGLWLVEKILSRRNAGVFAVSPREAPCP